MNEVFRIRKYFEYQWKSKTKYYLHSPFAYQFYLNVLEVEYDKSLHSINSLRQKLKNDATIVSVDNSDNGKSSTIKISDLERYVAVRKKYGELLYRLIKYFNCKSILELGTSIGINSSYMAVANPDAKIICLEASSSLNKLTRQNHIILGIKNIELIIGDFTETLSPSLKKLSSPDAIFFDGKHFQKKMLKYFYECLEHATENSIFIFDDIHRNQEMNTAWDEIKKHPHITLTIDVFQFGICFFKKDKLVKENFVLKY